MTAHVKRIIPTKTHRCLCVFVVQRRGTEGRRHFRSSQMWMWPPVRAAQGKKTPARRLSPRAVVLRARAVSPEPSRTEVSPPISCQRRGAASRVARRPAMTEATEKMLQQRHCPWICCWRHHDSVCFALINKIWRENKYFWKVLLFGFSVFVLFFFIDWFFKFIFTSMNQIRGVKTTFRRIK